MTDAISATSRVWRVPSAPVYAAGLLAFRAAPAPEFLLMRHPERWDLPKGHRDAGETPALCALREFEEETGIGREHIRVEPRFRFCTSYAVRYDTVVLRKTVFIYLGWLMPSAPADLHLTEHSGYQWCAWSPPHRFDNPTIDPLLAEVARFFAAHPPQRTSNVPE